MLLLLSFAFFRMEMIDDFLDKKTGRYGNQDRIKDDVDDAVHMSVHGIGIVKKKEKLNYAVDDEPYLGKIVSDFLIEGQGMLIFYESHEISVDYPGLAFKKYRYGFLMASDFEMECTSIRKLSETIFEMGFINLQKVVFSCLKQQMKAL